MTNPTDDNKAPEPADGSHIRPGDEVWLHENDCFLTRKQVKVLKIYKGGNVIVEDGNHTRQTHIHNLSANTEVRHGQSEE